MSCCGGNCGCGSGCKCGNGCGGCKMHSDFSSGESNSETLIVGIAPQKSYFGGSDASTGSENGGCNCGSNCGCGSNCTCAPCNCK